MLDAIKRDYITATEAARLLRVTRQRVQALKNDHKNFPEAHHLFGVTIFRRAEVEAWGRDRRSKP